MKVYCVRIQMDYEYNGIVAIFATREEAEANAEFRRARNTERNWYDEEISVEEWTIGESR